MSQPRKAASGMGHVLRHPLRHALGEVVCVGEAVRSAKAVLRHAAREAEALGALLAKGSMPDEAATLLSHEGLRPLADALRAHALLAHALAWNMPWKHEVRVGGLGCIVRVAAAEVAEGKRRGAADRTWVRVPLLVWGSLRVGCCLVTRVKAAVHLIVLPLASAVVGLMAPVPLLGPLAILPHPVVISPGVAHRVTLLVLAIQRSHVEAAIVGLAPGFRKGHHGLDQIVQGALHEAVVLLEMVDQGCPERIPCEDAGVAQHDHAVTCPGKRHVHAPRVGEEADALVLVGPHARKNDEVLLATLEGVHASHFNLLV
mmetsp:Transcript_63118/g.86779  ORF Transcript_63118/g.86779 Transcript_63118/m.86779 type:complete len:315 (+) Transcript_63118:1342-2286(+)